MNKLNDSFILYMNISMIHFFLEGVETTLIGWDLSKSRKIENLFVLINSWRWIYFFIIIPKV
jgi:hypothetical protein